MDDIILGVEIFGLLELLVIGYGALFESKNRSAKKKVFLTLLASVFVTVFVDMISYLPPYFPSFANHIYGFTFIAFIMPFVSSAMYILYLFTHMSERIVISKTVFRIGIIYCIFQAMMTVYFSLGGYLFVIDGGHYYPGEYYEGYLAAYIIVFIYILVVVSLYWRKAGFHDAIAALMFILVPIIFIVINLFNSKAAFGVASLSLSMHIIYTMLQAEHENELIKRGAKTYKLAHFDELTGLQNRLAYSETCKNISGNRNMGVVFADVNGLKYTNDNFGHEAGDKLLKEFSGVLLSAFRKDDIYRISGDEFVVVLRGVPKSVFEDKTQRLKDMLEKQDVPMASVGFVLGNESDDIKKLVNEAENLMYEEKKKFHENFPTYSRRG